MTVVANSPFIVWLASAVVGRWHDEVEVRSKTENKWDHVGGIDIRLYNIESNRPDWA